MLANRLHLAYPERRVRYLNTGIGGHSSRQMLARSDADILDHHPHWLSISAGVVEVRWHYQPNRENERVSLFDEFLRIERQHADEVHLNAKGDLLYSNLVYQYLSS